MNIETRVNPDTDVPWICVACGEARWQVGIFTCMHERLSRTGAFVAEKDSADVIEFYPGNEVRFLVTGADTDGTVEIFERLVPPGEMIADLHLHTDTTETFRVLQGEVEFTLGTEVRIVGAGGCVVAPPLTPHALRNSGDQPVILQIMFTPSRNHDRFFHLLQENWPGIGQRDQALTDRIRRKFDGFTCDSEGNPTDGLPRDATY